MRKKSKELLDNLNKITQKPNRFEPKPTTPDTNKMWKSAHESGITPLPKSYEPIKWNKEVDADGDVDYWTPFDRVYGGLGANSQRVVQKDGTEYKGKLHKKYRLIKGMDGKNFKSHCTVTDDGRWFDNGGFPIEPPKQVDIEPEAKPDEEDIQEQKRIAREREQRIIAGLK